MKHASVGFVFEHRPAGLPLRRTRGMKTRATNTSGYVGVSWSNAAGKWSAYIPIDGKRRNLDLFETAEGDNAAVVAKTSLQPPAPPAPYLAEQRAELLAIVRGLYEQRGVQPFATPVLEKQADKF
jgi:hypothetical protein